MPSLKIDHARYVLTLDRAAPHHPGRRDPGRERPHQRAWARRPSWPARADRVIDGRHFVVTPGLLQRAHAHQLRARRARHLPRRAGSPLVHVFNLQAAMTEEEEYHTTLLGLVELVKNGTVCFVDPGQHQVPRRVPAGLRGRRHPRDPGRVRDRPRRAVPAAALPGRRGGRAHRRRSSRSGTAGSTAGSARGRCRSPPRRAAPICCAGAQAPGRRAPHRR